VELTLVFDDENGIGAQIGRNRASVALRAKSEQERGAKTRRPGSARGPAMSSVRNLIRHMLADSHSLSRAATLAKPPLRKRRSRSQLLHEIFPMHHVSTGAVRPHGAAH